MSFYNYYKHSDTLIFDDVKVEEVSIELFNFNKIKETVKKVFKTVVDFFKRVFTWIKNKINKFFKSSVVKINTNKLKSIKYLKSYKILKDIDVSGPVIKLMSKDISLENITNNTDVSQYISYELRRAPGYYIALLFDGKNQVHNPEKIITMVDEIYNLVKNNHSHDGLAIALNKLIDDYNSGGNNRVITYGSLVDSIEHIPSMIAKAEKYYNEKYKELSIELNTINSELYNLTNENYNEEKYNRLYSESMRVQNLIKLVSIPISAMSLYLYIISRIVDKSFLFKYIILPYSSRKRLLHLSEVDNLDTRRDGYMIPGDTKPAGIPIVSTPTIFPDKISFGPDIKRCVAGIAVRIRDKSNDEGYLDLYVYEGMPDKTTLEINPKLVELEVGEYFFTDEIGIVSPIKIKKLGKVRIKYDSRKNLYDPSGYDYEFLEGGL